MADLNFGEIIKKKTQMKKTVHRSILFSVLGYHESAMKYYLEATMVASDLFSQPVPRTQIDDLVYRRMIKCCAQLQCYTQAAVLCQFLEEVDYALAFKMTSSDQKSCAAADAMDAYYHCIWDTTILEFLIHLHTKRGEHHRKQLAVSNITYIDSVCINQRFFLFHLCFRSK